MVKLDVVRSANVELVRSRPLVVVSAGGTSGIGECTLRELAKTAGHAGSKGLRVYLVGRSADTAGKLSAEFSKLCPGGEFTFVLGKDLALLKDVDNACNEIIDLERKREGDEAKIDVLLMSQGKVDFGPRKETSEGLDHCFSLLYYSRMRFVHNLLALLTNRTPPEDPAHVISIYAGGMEKSGKLFLDDLSLRDPKHFSFSNTRVHTVHLKAMFFERLARENPGTLSLVHVFPGLVITPAFYKPEYKWYFKLAVILLGPLVKVTVAVPLEETGQRMLFLASPRYPARQKDGQAAPGSTVSELPIAVANDGRVGGGSYSTKEDNETCKNMDTAYADLRKNGFPDQAWDHTMKAFETIETGKRFTE